MLAKNVNDNACLLVKRVVLRFFASMLAPTGGAVVACLIVSNIAPTYICIFLRRAAHPQVCRFSLREIALWMVFSCSNWSTA